ncbi:MAG: VOC family protein [Anaerolineaceae bacterium]|nr:VOC family protein [Anaerolineaceae bacterium]
MAEGRYIKHMAFAVKDAALAWQQYRDFLGIGHDGRIEDYEKSRNRVVLFEVGGVEYQLCQSMDEGGRYDQWIKDRGQEGLHHICYAVPDIEEALAEAQARGGTLKLCPACNVTGSHVHPEGWVAFLEEEPGGIELEMMQVYTPEELEEYKAVQGI